MITTIILLLCDIYNKKYNNKNLFDEINTAMTSLLGKQICVEKRRVSFMYFIVDEIIFLLC